MKTYNLESHKRKIIKIFYKFNPNADSEDIDWDELDDESTFEENLQNIADMNPQYIWADYIDRSLFDEKERQKEILHDAGVDDDGSIYERILRSYPDVSDFTDDELHRLANQEKEQIGEVFSAVTKVKPHKSKVKGKKYSYGRVQLTVDKRYVGMNAKIIIFWAKGSE